MDDSPPLPKNQKKTDFPTENPLLQETKQTRKSSDLHSWKTFNPFT